jgi:integrase
MVARWLPEAIRQPNENEANMGTKSEEGRIHRITKRAVDALRAGAILWDTGVKGFGVRCRASGSFYMVKYRARGRQRWYTIGRHGAPWTVEQARREARSVLGDVARGVDPAEARAAARRDPSVAELCDLYLAEGCATKKPSTLASDRGRIEGYIKPLLGRKRLHAVTRADVERFMQDVAAGKTSVDVKTRPHGRAIVKGGKGTASRTVGLLGGIFTFAVNRRLRADNPVRGVKRFADRKLDRFLSDTELARLGDVLATAERGGTETTFMVAAIRLLLFTGARLGEILGLRWEHVDIERAYLGLPDSKTGQKVLYLNAPALQVLAELPRVEGNPFVICGEREGAHLVNLEKPWQRIRARAGLDDVRLHDLRHSFASIGAAGGLSLPMIGKLLGHTQAATTERYAHLAADPVRAANEAIGERIAAAMRGQADAEVVELERHR